jgi:hypothetical protein
MQFGQLKRREVIALIGGVAARGAQSGRHPMGESSRMMSSARNTSISQLF